MKGARRLAILALALALAAAALCCGEKGDPVKGTLDRMVAAAHERDAEAFVKNLAPEFSAADGMTMADARTTLKRYFAAYAILDVSLRDVVIERSENAARVRFTAELSGQPRTIGGLEGLLPRSSTWKFDLRLAPENGRFKVAWASWEPAGLSAAAVALRPAAENFLEAPFEGPASANDPGVELACLSGAEEPLPQRAKARGPV